MIRQTSVVGAFYPNLPDEIVKTFEYFNEVLDGHFGHKLYEKNPKALLVPHAGYVYSGFSANMAYRNVLKEPSSIVVIGPSHRLSFEGMSMCSFEAYETPLGEIKADNNLKVRLQEKFDFVNIPLAHQEHSTEVQFPFLKYYFPKAKLLEIVYSSFVRLEELISYLIDENILVIISSDLSHFYPQQKAEKLDRYCIQAVENIEPKVLEKCEACGKEGIRALINITFSKSLKTQSLDYRTSAEVSEDKNSVVGYYSAMVY